MLARPGRVSQTFEVFVSPREQRTRNYGSGRRERQRIDNMVIGTLEKISDASTDVNGAGGYYRALVDLERGM